MFHSRVFAASICQRFELTKILRQHGADPRFISALAELRLGKCSRENELFLQSLNRPLSAEFATRAIHIFFRRTDAQLHNLDVLSELPGNVIGPLVCEDVGNTRGLISPAEPKLLFKPHCRVMLVWNLNDQLRNGSSGALIGVERDTLIVNFDNVGRYEVKRQTWYKRDRNGVVVGSRNQFPLVLFYAATCHKSQGLTLPAAVVHCSQEFVSGLTYVSLTRVRHESQIQVQNFLAKSLLCPPQDAIDICRAPETVPVENLSCCRHHVLPEQYFLASDDGLGGGEDFDEYDDPHESVGNMDGLVQSYFERDEDEVVLDLANVLLVLESEMSQVKPPEDISSEDMLNRIRPPNPGNPMAHELCGAIDALLSTRDPFSMFVKVTWFRLFQVVEDFLVENDEDLFISRQEFTAAVNTLYTKIICSASHRSDLKALFQASKLSNAHRCIGSSVCLQLYTKCVHDLAACVIARRESETIPFDVSAMPSEGLAKLRHVGAWAIRKILEESRRYVRNNMLSQSPQTRAAVRVAHAKAQLLQECVIAQFSNLQGTTAYPETLVVTEDRQYRERGLLHISDAAFQFFLNVEQMRVDLINETKLMQAGHKGTAIDAAISEVEQNPDLLAKWKVCFSNHNLQQMMRYLFLHCYER